MSLFSRLSANKEKRDFLRRVDGMKMREVNFVATEWDSFIASFEHNPEVIMTLSPVNYYALKKEYIGATCWSDGECSENYIVFRYVKDDIKSEKIVAESKPYTLECSLFKRMMSKFGIML
ncbi:MAG: hypothetical protein E7507_05015 [Ruminococcus sp.]|nr:hypothetical protein [Ruminococcus sp.]